MNRVCAIAAAAGLALMLAPSVSVPAISAASPAVAVPTMMSDPMGVYCILDKVVLTPTEEPENAQLWGACAIANTNDWLFQPAARGYFYFAIPKGQETAVRNEWTDLKSVAGTGEAVGFARRYKPVGRFRKEDEKPANPDLHPLNIGVVKMGTTTRVVPEVRDVIEQLRAISKKK